MPFIGRQPVIGNFVKLDAISVVNGQAAYTMQNGGVNFTSYDNVNQFLVSLNGVLQAPTDSFTVSGSTITFASNLVTGDVIDFIIVLGNTLDVGVPSDNTISTAKLQDSSVSLAKLTATGTKDATTFLRGDNTFAEVPAGGITEADQWRLTVTKTDNTDISANLERVDDASFGYIGTGMTQSSGIFTFPSTGIYQISTTFKGYSSNTSDTMKIVTYASIDSGSTYDAISETAISTTTSATLGDTATSHVFVNVTNTSTVKVKFVGESLSSGSAIEGNTDINQTHFTFIRLGDST